MVYAVNTLKSEIRVALDQNMTSTALSVIGDVDTLSLEDIIESKIADAARFVEANAPHELLGSGHTFGESLEWDSAPGYGSGHIVLPDDFLRLVCFQMSDWSYAVTDAITEDSPQYAMQRSRFPGIRGCPQKPVVAITTQPIGLVLEFYSCMSGANASVKRASYIPIPSVEEGDVELCEKLKPSIVYYAAYLTALSIGNSDLAQSMLKISGELGGFAVS